MRLIDHTKLKQQVADQRQRLLELESDIASNNMPWDVDPELQDMTACELRSIMYKDLTPKEQARLNEMCVQEQEKELKVKITTETSLIWEISSLKKELQKSQIKLSHLESQQSVVKAVLNEKTATKRR